MSSSQKAVNVGGAIRSLSSLGFRNQDLIPEGIDNSLDAGATKINITIDANKNFILADNAKGMSKTQLQDRFILYNDSDATNQKQGRFGVGNNVMHSLLCGNETSTKSITYGLNPPRIPGSGPDTLKHHEIVLDWPNAVAHDEFILHASPLEEESKEEWKKYAIDKTKSGTIDIIHLSDPMFKYFTEKDPETDIPTFTTLCDDLSRMYTQYLEEGIEITLTLLKDTRKLQPMNLLAVSQGDNVKPLTKTVRELWAKPDGTLRMYYRDGGKNWVYWGKKPDTNAWANIQKYPATDEGYTKIGQLHISQAFDPEWTKVRGGTGKGGIYFKRNKKIIHRTKIDVTGGSPDQILKRERRTVVMFEANKQFDALFGILVNKSHIVKINEILSKELMSIHEGFVSVPKEKKAKSPSPSPPNTPRPVPPTPTPAPSPAPTPQAMLGYQDFRKANSEQVRADGFHGGGIMTELARRYKEYKKEFLRQVTLTNTLTPASQSDADSTSVSSQESNEHEPDTTLTTPARQTVIVTSRLVPQSEQALVEQVIKFRNAIATMNLETLLTRAGNEVKEGISAKSNTLLEIVELLKKIEGK